MAVQQLAHRGADPGREVGAVGDVADRHLVERSVGPQLVPHLARDLAVAAADGVGGAAEPQRRLRHAERLVWVLGVRPAQRDHVRDGSRQLLSEAADRVLHLVARIRVVAGRHGRVRREHRPGLGGLERVLERLARAQRLAGELERCQRRVAFVEVDHGRFDAQGAQRAHAADAQQDVLRKPRALVGDVQARGDPALERPILRTLGVEQEQRHATDVDAPDLGDDIGVVDRHRDRQWLAGLVGHERRRQPLRIGVDPVLVLPTACIDALTEVALAVHQADGDHRQPAIGRLLEQVAGERPEAAGVHRQRQVHAVLGAQERDRPVDRKPGVGGALQIGVDGRLEHRRAFDRAPSRPRPGAAPRSRSPAAGEPGSAGTA